MTRRVGKEASEIRSGIGADERQPVMARLAAPTSCSVQFDDIGNA